MADFTLTSVEQMVTMENSAYELWKGTVGTGNMNDPKKSRTKSGHSDKVSEYDFFPNY